MAVYFCHSFKRRYRRANVRVRIRKFRGRVLKKIVPIFYKCTSRRFSFKKRLQSFRLVISSFPNSGRFSLDSNLILVRSFQSENFQNISRITSISSRYLSKKIYYYSNIYRFSNFRGSAYKKIVLFATYDLKIVKQNLDYFVFNKSDLAESGLLSKENNSFEELLLALLIFWESTLDSSRINVGFYRYLKVVEELQWFEIQSLLISARVSFSESRKDFPSPKSFLI